MKRYGLNLIACALLLPLLAGCAAHGAEPDEPALPQPENTPGMGENASGKSAADLIPARLAHNESGVPMLKVYVKDDEKIEEMSVEDYLPAVLAGEMAGDWPLEALKAQAILARTFVMQFVTQKTSRYAGADISTDIEEAQAYDASGVNARIREAVRATRGQVLNAGGEFPYAWFHAHSGGLTARAKEGLDYEKDEPGYTQCVRGMEDDDAPEEAAHWSARFTPEEVLAAAKDVGVLLSELTSVAVGQRGESGRATTLLLSGKEVSAPALRIAIGSTRMRSCLLESLRMEDGEVVMEGKGYGHGVGMSQWGAYAMARRGSTAEEIVTHYFRGVSLDQAWD